MFHPFTQNDQHMYDNLRKQGCTHDEAMSLIQDHYLDMQGEE